MATVTVTTTPQTLDSLGASELGVRNTGSVPVIVGPYTLRPGQYRPVSVPVVASTQSGSTTVETNVAVAAPSKDVRQTARTYMAQTPAALNPLPQVAASPPTVTESAANAATTVTNPTSISLSNLLNYVTVYGANISTAADASYYTPTSVTPGNTSTFQPFAVEFVTDSALFDISVRGNSGKYRVVCDGQLVSQDGSQLAVSAGSNVRLIINPGSRKFRTWRLESASDTRVGQITLSRTDTIVPSRYRGPRCIIVGDSIVEGTGATARFTAWPWLFGHLMGWADTWASGSGGTGYTVNGSPTYTGRKKVRDRLASDVLAYSPDVVILAAGRNDLSAVVADVQAELSGCLTDIKQALPNALTFVTSPIYLGTPSAAATTLNTALAATAAVQGVTFVNLLSPVIFGGTGKAGTTTSDGPADILLGSDGTHPTQAGHEAIARAVAQHVSNALRRAAQ